MQIDDKPELFVTIAKWLLSDWLHPRVFISSLISRCRFRRASFVIAQRSFRWLYFEREPNTSGGAVEVGWYRIGS